MTDPTFSPFTGLAKHPAAWTGHGLVKRHYELRSDTVRYATLDWESAFGSRAQARTRDAAWTLKRVGFFSPRVTVRTPESEIDIAIYHPDWVGNGRVELPGGKHWRFKCLSFWRSRYGFLDEAGEPLIEYQASTFKVPPTADVVVAPQALALAELPLLTVLGWYITILAFDDMAGAGAAAAAAG